MVRGVREGSYSARGYDIECTFHWQAENLLQYFRLETSPTKSKRLQMQVLKVIVGFTRMFQGEGCLGLEHTYDGGFYRDYVAGGSF